MASTKSQRGLSVRQLPGKRRLRAAPDGATAKGLNLRSFYSVIIYLNTPPEVSGGTRFYQSGGHGCGSR